MLQKSTLQENSDRLAYQRGNDLFRMGNVHKLTATPHEDIPAIVIVRAEVKGSGRNTYAVKLQIDEEEGIIDDYSCECPAYYAYDGMCKHCVAACLSYISRRDGKMLPSADAPGVSVFLNRQQSASKLMRHYDKHARLSLMQPKLLGKVELVPELTVQSGQIYVNFRIGAEKKYVLKSIPDFVFAVENSMEVSYGQKLSFYHIMENFTPDSRRLVRFLKAEVKRDSRQGLGVGRFAYYYASSGYRSGSDRRVLALTEANMDGFMQAVWGRELSVIWNGEGRYDSKTSVWHLEEYEEEACRETFSLTGFSGGATLQGNFPLVVSGVNYFYLWQDFCIYRVSREEKEDLLAFYENADTYGGQKMTLTSEELPGFCREVLPVLEKHFKLEQENFDPALYLPPKPEFEIYLDSPQKDLVSCKLLAVYGENKYNVYANVSGRAMRDEAAEIRMGQLVADYFQAYDESSHTMVLSANEDQLYEFLTVSLEELRQLGTVYVSDELHTMRVSAAPHATVGISLSGDLLEFSVTSEELSPDQLAEILSRYDRRKKYYRFKDGMFVSMEGSDLETLSRIRETLQLTEKELKNGTALLPKFRALYLDSELKENIGLHAVKDKNFKSLIRSMKTIEDNDYELPDSLKDILREYQKQGFLWIKTLKNNGFGGILADEMGLGKTLQVIAFLLSEKEEGEDRESLIVCPASLVYNWKAELERFAPTLSAAMVIGSVAERKALIEAKEPGRILITSYDLLKRDSEFYGGKRFATQIIDEAQYIKNHSTHAAKASKAVPAGFKLALTGTPIENRLSELWSIFDYLMPGFLYGYQRFREELEIPIVQKNDEDATNRLRKMIGPFILRRLKKDVLKDLPEKLEENMVTQLGGEQWQLYTAHVQRIRMMLDHKTEEEFNAGKLQILAELTKLRQLCCDPALLLEGYKGEAAKLELCMDILKNAMDGGHKVLLFSQFTTMLSRIQDRLKAEEIPYYSLTGATPKEQRARMVEAFNRDDTPVFCISLKAGGTGLNLTAADIVIHYDPWWNISVQNQATDRAHRIGQKKVVSVYKLIAKDTIEENIVKLQEKKSALAEEMLGGEELNNASFTKEALLELLR